MRKPTFNADKESYRKAGFFILDNYDGSVTIVPLILPPGEFSMPEVGVSFDPQDTLFFQCALSIGIWGPLGNFIIEPSEKGLVFQGPNLHSLATPITMTLMPRGRTVRRFGSWIIDIVYWLDEMNTGLVERPLTQVFKEVSKAEVLILERLIKHKTPAYHSPYRVTFREDGAINIALKEGLLNRFMRLFRKWNWLWPREVSVTLGKLEWTGIEIKFKK